MISLVQSPTNETADNLPLSPVADDYGRQAGSIPFLLRSMKLLMISGDRSILQGRRGAFWYTLQEMRKHWNRIDIICPKVQSGGDGLSESGHRLHQEHSEGGDVYFHPCPKGLLYQSKWIVTKGEHLIRAHRHNVMTVHDYPPFYNGKGARKLHALTNIPYAVEIHHIVGYPHAANVQEWVGKLMSRGSIQRNALDAKAVRVVNGSVKEKLVSWGVPESKIHIISSLYLDRDMLSQEHKPPVAYDVSFCGRLVANKGLSEVIDACSKLPEMRLLIIGDGPERVKMEKKVQSLGLKDRVAFLGWLPTQEGVSGAMQTARMFVMNSKSEGGPRVALEAMGCGLPVIATKVGVMPEVIEDGVNGLFTTGKADDLVKKIGMLIQDDAKREALGNEAKKVLDRYERGKLVADYADFLKRLA